MLSAGAESNRWTKPRQRALRGSDCTDVFIPFIVGDVASATERQRAPVLFHEVLIERCVRHSDAPRVSHGDIRTTTASIAPAAAASNCLPAGGWSTIAVGGRNCTLLKQLETATDAPPFATRINVVFFHVIYAWKLSSKKNSKLTVIRSPTFCKPIKFYPAPYMRNV